jgi:perosamine synthetase
MRDRIPVAAPALVGNEKRYVEECLDSSWISSNGQFIGLFEESFARFCGVRHALACNTGTAAIHLALLGLGVGPGDEVITPTLTFVATANAVTYCGARPVFVDSEERTWNLDPARLEALIGPRTKAIVVVHLYGQPADMDAVLEIARRRGVPVVEDAAEAHGAEYRGHRVGSMGDVAAFSFYGNKVITTGEGGMVVTDDGALAERVRQLKGQGVDPGRRYWFPMVGYNYRMTNIEAAIGLAQLERIDWHTARRREIAARYATALAGAPGLELQREAPGTRHAFWMTTVRLLGAAAARRDAVMAELDGRGVETRPVFHPMHTLPMYAPPAGASFPVAERLAASGFNLPSSASLSADDQDYVCAALLDALRALSEDR